MKDNAKDYYDDRKEWGSYQYITLDEIVNNYIMSTGQDDFTYQAPRYQVLYQARRGIRELYFDVMREIKSVALEISPQLTTIFPPDFINYVRISWVDAQGIGHPIVANSSSIVAQKYLQDNKHNILFDNEGGVLKGSNNFSNTQPTIPLKGTCKYAPNANASNIYKNGYVTIDKSSGMMKFSSDIQGKTVALEYISDGLFQDNENFPEHIKIHKFAEQALIDFIYHKLIERRRNVPMNEKTRSRKHFFNSRRVTKRRINTLRKEEILQVFAGSSKTIK